MHVYEVRPRKDHRGADLISDALPFGRLWYGEPDAITNAIGYAKFRSRSHDAVIRVYDEAGNVIETHEHAGISKNGDLLCSGLLPPGLAAKTTCVILIVHAAALLIETIGTLFIFLDVRRLNARFPSEPGVLGTLGDPLPYRVWYYRASSLGFALLFIGILLSGVCLWLQHARC